MYIIYGTFNVNSKIFFPVLVTIYFAPVIINEFKYKTVKLLFSSVKTREEIYIGQFIGASLVFITVFMTLLVSSVVLVSFLTSPDYIFVEIYAISYIEALQRILAVSIIAILFMICLGSFVFMVSVITESQGLTLFIVLLVLLMYTVLPLPEWISHNLFLRGIFIYDMISIYDIQMIEMVKYAFIFIIYAMIFIGVGSFIFGKKQV